MATKALTVFLEIGSKKVFAAALDWPGWCRAARTEEAAIEALGEYLPRYKVVADRAGITFPARLASFDVIERLKGDASTDFGAPGAAAEAEAARVTPAAARRQAALVTAAWDIFDDVVAVSPEELRKGPRGGGRDRDKMVAHVIEAEFSYARKLGVKHKPPASPLDDSAAIAALRQEILGVLSAASNGGPVVDRGWTSRYAARRIAWHVLDHAWEMEDRAQPSQPGRTSPAS